MMTKPNYYFRILTALTVTAAAAVLAALFVASAPASAQESGSFVMPGSAYPGDQWTRVSRDTYVSVELSDAMDPTSINADTFTLVKQGTTTPVEASVTYLVYPYYSEWGPSSGFQYWATLDPKADLEANATYTATLKGGDIGVKDFLGRSMPKDHSWYFSTGDSITPPPETTINSGPSGPVTSTSASFAFSSSESGSTFQCRLVDSTSDSDWSACSSPKAYTGLSAGSHTFYVKAIGPAGNPDTTPASRTWTVDKTAPTVDSFTPSPDGVTGVSLSTTPVTATFSEEMKDLTLNSPATNFKLQKLTGKGKSATYENVAGVGVASQVSTRADGTKFTTATLTPNSSLAANSSYKVIVTQGATDLAGNPLTPQQEWTFKTGRT